MSTKSSDNQKAPSCRRAGRFVFATGLLGEPGKPGPFAVAPVKRQARAIFARLEKDAGTLGASLNDTLGLQQYYTSRDMAAFYSEERRRHFPNGAPTSTSIACARLGAPDALVQVDAILAIPDAQHVVRRETGSHPNAGYAHTLAFGDWIFCSGVLASGPSGAAYEGGPGTAVVKEARLDPNYWFGLAIKSEITHIVTSKLAAVLESSGTSRDNIAFAHVHLLDPVRDVAPFLEIWSELCPQAVTVISASQGFGAHGPCTEVTTIALRSGGGLKLTPLEVSFPRPFALGPVAGRAGDLVFTSLLAAADECGLAAAARIDRDREYLEDQTGREMAIILDQIDTICSAAGAAVRDLVRLRLYVSSMLKAPAAIAALKARGGDAIPFSLVEDPTLPAWIPGCTVTADAIIHVPA
jgi:enamine deaminase RidA (YjgF/YER057c/UK114 family)